MSSGFHSGGSSVTGQGSNSANVRLFNERVILDALRRLGQASKADLSRHVKLTNNTAGVIVKDLEERKLIRAEGKRAYGRGLPATLLSLDPRGAYAIGVRFGRRLIDVLLVDFSGQPLGRRHHDLDPGMPDEAMALVLRDIVELWQTLPNLPKPHDRHRHRHPLRHGKLAAGTGYLAEVCRAWNETDIATRIEEETGLPVFCENNERLAQSPRYSKERDVD